MARKSSEALQFTQGNMKELSGAELEYMNFIWTNPDGIDSEKIYAHFDGARGTKTTILHRIVEKGYLEMVQNGRHYLYYPKVSKLEYNQAVMKKTMKKAFGISSIENFITAFCGKNEIDEEEKSKISEFLNDLQN